MDMLLWSEENYCSSGALITHSSDSGACLMSCAHIGTVICAAARVRGRLQQETLIYVKHIEGPGKRLLDRGCQTSLR